MGWLATSVMLQGLDYRFPLQKEGWFLLSVKMTSSSILDMQRCEWPETLTEICYVLAVPHAAGNGSLTCATLLGNRYWIQHDRESGAL